MTIDEFVTNNNLRPGDAIVMRKTWLPMVDHYVLYYGYENEQHRWIANYINGVFFLPRWRLQLFLDRLTPERIERFPGNEQERIEAMKRAKDLAGWEAYSWISNNCEHFKNYIHTGEFRSPQVIKIANTAMICGLAAMSFSLVRGKSKLALLGLLLAAAGATVRGMERKSRSLTLPGGKSAS